MWHQWKKSKNCEHSLSIKKPAQKQVNSASDNGMNVRECDSRANANSLYTSVPLRQSSDKYQATSVTCCQPEYTYQNSLNYYNSSLSGHSGTITEAQPNPCADIQRGATYPTFSPLAPTFTTINQTPNNLLKASDYIAILGYPLSILVCLITRLDVWQDGPFPERRNFYMLSEQTSKRVVRLGLRIK